MKMKLKKYNLFFALITLFIGNLMNAQVNHLVISQVYGAGGNAGAAYRNDYVEIFNPTGSTISLTGWSLQYAGATGTSWTVGSLSGSIAAGKYYLVSMASGGTNGTLLPSADATASGINMSATAGKIALVNNTTALTGSCTIGASVVDFVGFGTTANCFEGAGPTPAPSSTNSVFRASNGCTDTDVNSTNFASAAANPRNSGTASNVCSSGAPTQLVITSVNPVSPSAGVGFSVTVQSQDGSNAPQNVVANTVFLLSTNGNAGSIGGTITGTINAGSSSVVISGVTLATAGTNVNVTATRTSGDVLTAGTSSTFSVVGVASQLTFVGTPALGFQSTDIGGFTVEARRTDGSVDNNYTGLIVVSKGSGPGNLSGTTSVNAVAGIATFTALQFSQTGVYTLNANSGVLTPATSSSINISSNPVTWNFISGNAAATGVPANLTVSVLSQGNNNGTTTLVTGTSVSSGYPGASGTNNAGAAARTGVLNTAASGSAYFEFTLTPAANNIVTLKGLTFGSRSTSTGPQAFSVRSSSDNYASTLSTGTTFSTSTWALSSPSFSTTSSGVATPITFRIYGHNGIGTASANTANWRVDDILLDLDVQPCSQPTINVNSGAICIGNTFTISPSGGVSYSVTGNSFTVSPTVPASYTVTGVDAVGCTNTVVSSVAVNALPTISVNSGSICAGNSFTISPNGANTYTISGGASIVSPSANTDYTITGTSAQGCLSSNQAVSSVTVNTLPIISVNANPASVCSGYTSTLTASGTISYSWNTGQSTSVINVAPPVNTSYTVTGTDANGCSNKASVTLTVTNCPSTTSLTPVSCGSTITSLDDVLYYHAVTGASNYKVEVVNAQQPFNVVNIRNRTVPDFKLSWIPGTQYGRTYTIRVSAYVGGVWKSFGPSCTVTTASVTPTAQLSAGSCNVTLTSLNQTLNFGLVGGATNYKFEVVNAAQSFSVVNVRNNTVSNFNLSWISGIQYGRTYDIRISAYVNNTWQAWGNTCSVTTPANIPTTQLTSTVCNTSVASRGTVFTYDPVVGATNYKLLLVNAAQSFSVTNVRNTTTTNFALSYVTTTQVGKTYDVSVSAQVGGVWAAYGQACQVTALSAKDGGVVDFANAKTIDHNSISEEATFELNVYPNPNQGLFNIELTAASQVMITNTLGQVVLNETMEAGKSNLNIESQPIGIYFVRVTQNDKQQTLKLIKQ